MRCFLPTPPPRTPTQFDFFRNFVWFSAVFEYEVPRYRFFFFNSNHLVFLRLPGSVVWFCICFGKLLGLYYWYFKYFFHFFLSPSDIPIAYILFLCGCPTVLGHSGVLFLVLLSLLLSVFDSYWHTFRLADSFLHRVLSVDELIEYITHFLFSATSCLLMSLPFNFLLKARHDILYIKNKVK